MIIYIDPPKFQTRNKVFLRVKLKRSSLKLRTCRKLTSKLMNSLIWVNTNTHLHKVFHDILLKKKCSNSEEMYYILMKIKGSSRGNQRRFENCRKFSRNQGKFWKSRRSNCITKPTVELVQWWGYLVEMHLGRVGIKCLFTSWLIFF